MTLETANAAIVSFGAGFLGQSLLDRIRSVSREMDLLRIRVNNTFRDDPEGWWKRIIKFAETVDDSLMSVFAS
ncbi:MAG: hypothetical protein RML32_15120, partial [Gammaproteobacteria bacterium]|nr:hypothetical protein [Gammaproteobacteria bacterium]